MGVYMNVRFKKLPIVILFSFLLIVVSSLAILAQSSVKLGVKEIKVSKDLEAGQVMTHNIELESNIKAISYYIRSENVSMCWLRVYDSNGKNIYSKDFGHLLGRFLGRSETYIIENLTTNSYTLDILAPSYHSCTYELYLKGLTKEELKANPETEFYKMTQEITKKNDTINLLNRQINDLREERNSMNIEIQNLEKEKENMNTKINLLQEKINLLIKISIALFVIIIGIVSYYFYIHKSKIKSKIKK